MTEYWKSNPRHWCDVCKVWLDAKKMSIKHHEAGAKHKEKAAAKMKDMRRARLDREFKERDAEMEMKRIEMAAMKAYRADMFQAVSVDDLRGGDGEAGDGSDRPLKMARMAPTDGIGPAGPPPGVALKPRFPPGMFPPKSKKEPKKDDPFSYSAPEDGEEPSTEAPAQSHDMPALEGSSSEATEGEATTTDAATADAAEEEAGAEEAAAAPIDESTGLGEWQTVEVSMFGDAKPSKKMKQNKSRDAPRHWATETPRLPKVGKGAFDGPSKTLYEDDDEDPTKDDSVAADYGYSAVVGGKTEERYEVPEDDEDQPAQPIAFKKRKSKQPKSTRSALS